MKKAICKGGPLDGVEFNPKMVEFAGLTAESSLVTYALIDEKDEEGRLIYCPAELVLRRPE